MIRSYTHVPRTILWLVPGGVLPRSDSKEEPIDPFYLSKWPITNEQYEAFDSGYRRSELSRGDRKTALGITFERAKAYCDWYAEVSRKPMRLPSEGEWEHACRGGSAGKFFWGDDPSQADLYQWDADNWQGQLPAADQKKANGFGLYGMLGSAWEWTADGVLRGGSFRTSRARVSCSVRQGGREHSDPGTLEDVGFRVAKSFR